ncbi:MAG: beta-lactamase family protein [Bacteroidales bacterium]|nr:beta-lactamase family protein [Bacteroidales bacterium]
MRIAVKITLLLLLIVSCRRIEDIDPSHFSCSLNFADSSLANPGNSKYQALLEEMTGNGVVGVEMAVYKNNSGMWLGASGKASLHDGVDMKPCNKTRVGSTIKMFTAAIVFKLQEEGKLDLDDRIADHLGGETIDRIRNADKATIRQLLHHSSGIYNYIQNLKFQTASLNDLVREWHAEDLLKYAYNQQPYFGPSEDVFYSNTNYILLGLLIEKIEGKPLYQVFDEGIIEPLGLAGTQFAGKDPVPDDIVRGYIDLYSNLNVIESTYYSGWDYYCADGGLISNAYDMNEFFRALMGGQIISSSSLGEMLTWERPSEQDPEFYEIEYGLGIFRMNTSKGVCYFHSGDAIGYYANMIYFPDDGTTIVYAVNSNYGKIDQYVSTKSAIDKIISTVRE